MKSNQSGGGYNAKNTAAAAKQLMRNQKDGGSMMKRHKFSRNSAHGTSMYKEDGPSVKGVPPGSAAHRRKSNGSTLTSSSKQAPAKTGMKTVDPRSNSLKMTSKSMPAKQGVKTGKTRKIVGENTSKIKKDSRGKDYSLIMEGPMKGDTVRPGNAPRIDNYIQGGDYKVKNMGNKNFKIKGGASMSASQDRSASMDDYSHEKKLKADGRYEAAHGKMANAKNDFNHAHALKKDAHHDAKGRHSILKHMRKF